MHFYITAGPPSALRLEAHIPHTQRRHPCSVCGSKHVAHHWPMCACWHADVRQHQTQRAKLTARARGRVREDGIVAQLYMQPGSAPGMKWLDAMPMKAIIARRPFFSSFSLILSAATGSEDRKLLPHPLSPGSRLSVYPATWDGVSSEGHAERRARSCRIRPAHDPHRWDGGQRRAAPGRSTDHTSLWRCGLPQAQWRQ